MHPAALGHFFFTTASGAGYGMLFWLGVVARAVAKHVARDPLPSAPVSLGACRWLAASPAD